MQEVDKMSVQGVEAKRPSIVEAQAAVRSFLQQALPEARRVNVSRLAPLDPDQGTWEAEAEVWQPNATIQSLGLRTRRPVLDQEVYLVHLDGQLNVLDYEVQT
jgi:hypothetical protein